jgi:hypothetical protein
MIHHDIRYMKKCVTVGIRQNLNRIAPESAWYAWDVFYGCPSKLLPGAALGRPTLGGDRASRHDLDMEEIVKMC